MGDPVAYDYLRDPNAIYEKSFAIARGEADLSGLPDNLHDVALRLVHACGMPDLPADLAWGGDPANVGAAQAALLHRARMTATARQGAYSPEMEKELATACCEA